MISEVLVVTKGDGAYNVMILEITVPIVLTTAPR